MTTDLRDIEDEMENIGYLGFPTTSRPQEYRRAITTDHDQAQAWMKENTRLLGPLVTKEEWPAVADLLYTWKDLFVERVTDMPATRLVEHRIPTYPWATPRAAKLPLYTEEEKSWQVENLPKMVDAGIIIECMSPWSARTKFPRKTSGKLRMVHNFMPINAATIKMNYPLRRIEPVIANLSKKRWKVFFKVDAANGYWAVPLAIEHSFKTGFNSILGQFCYLRMGQGLTGAPGTYSKLKDLAMGAIPEPSSEAALTSLPGVGFEYFMDDDAAATENMNNMVSFLHQHYFPRLAWAGLTLNPAKSVFFTDEIEILGHQCTHNGLRPSITKLEALRAWPEPTNEEELMRFIYLLPFLKVYIPGRADYTAILKKALKYTGKGKTKRLESFKWGEEQRKVFQILKRYLLEVKLSGGDPKLQYHLSTDASNGGLGGVLFQMTEHPVGTKSSRKTHPYEVPVMYLSFALSDPETHYTTTEKEVLAVLRGLEETRWLILGSPYPVIVYTDHTAVKSVTGEHSEATGRLARWHYRLQEYQVDYVHVPGKLQVVADGLSRIPYWKSTTPGTEEDGFPLLSFANMEDCQPQPSITPKETHEELYLPYLQDTWYKQTVEELLKGRIDKRFSLINVEGEYLLAYHEANGKWSQCVLQSQLQGVLCLLHDVHGHFAARISLGRAIGRYYWPCRYQTLVEYCRSCPQCQVVGLKPPKGDPRAVISLEPLQLFAMDYIGPITPTSRMGARYILVGADYFSKYVFAHTATTATTQVSVHFLKHDVGKHFGLPQYLYTDNGRHFTGEGFTTYLRNNGVKHVTAPVTAPWSVGFIERIVRMIVGQLRTIGSLDSLQLLDWDSNLPSVIKAINTRHIEDHGFSPAEILFGFSPRHAGAPRIEDLINLEGIEVRAETDLRSAIESKAARVQEARDLMTESRVTLPPPTLTRLAEGDLVLLWDTVLEKDKGRKLDPRWRGPFLLKKLMYHKRSAVLEDLITKLQVGRYHVDHLKRFIARSSDAIEEAKELRQRLLDRQREAKRLIKEARGQRNPPEAIPVELEETSIWKGGIIDLQAGRYPV
ncbi:hypothetical protein LV161_008779 [Aspergillus fumigatus]|nr:hypothetical protein LV161_008779 [Aspergillus fumigatus]KAJ8207001.1 hypothetical protein LV158_006213 [Aspergillus fumigatus]